MKAFFLTLLVWGGMLLAAMFGNAQTGMPFTTSTEATALHFGNAWNVANHTTESLDVFDWGAAKGSSLSVEGHELIGAPTVGWNAYLGGVKVQPDISKLMARSNVSSDLFGVYAQGAVGAAGLQGGSRVSFLAGVGAQYRMTPNLAWNTVNFRYLRVGSENGYEISSGLAYYFNPAASKSLAIQKMIQKRALLKRLSQ